MTNTEHTTEIWRPIDAAPSYMVSSYGRVARVAGGQGARPMLRRQDLEHTGYYRVRLSENGKTLRFSVHRLVAIAFLGEPPTPAHQVAHYDGVKTNNRVDNLRWATCAENIRDKQRHGTQIFGEQQPRAKLNRAAVQEIRESTESSAALARKFHVSWTTIDGVRKKRTWNRV